VLDELNNSDENSYAGTGRYGVNSKEGIVLEDNAEKNNRVRSSQKDDSQILMRQKCKVVEEKEDEYSVAIKKIVYSFLPRHEVESQRH